MAPIVIQIVIYVLLCLLVSWYGKGTRLGFWGVLLLSIMVTPLVVGVGVVLLAPFNQKIFKPYQSDRLQ